MATQTRRIGISEQPVKLLPRMRQHFSNEDVWISKVTERIDQKEFRPTKTLVTFLKAQVANGLNSDQKIKILSRILKEIQPPEEYLKTINKVKQDTYKLRYDSECRKLWVFAELEYEELLDNLEKINKTNTN